MMFSAVKFMLVKPATLALLRGKKQHTQHDFNSKVCDHFN